MTWARESGALDWQKHMPPKGFRRVATSVGRREDVFMDRPEQEDEPLDYERLPESAEAFIYIAMSRLMARRLARP
jgi:transposase